MISYLTDCESQFLSNIEFIKLTPFRVENSVEGWEAAEKMAKLISKRMTKARVRLDLSDADPIKQYMESLKVRKFQERDDFDISVTESEKSDVSRDNSTVWKTDMTQF